MPDAEDDELLDRFVRGDQDAFERLFREHQQEVYRWILRVVRDGGAAEDVLVETFWRAYRGRARFDASRSFGAWIRRIARNAALDHVRKVRPGGGHTVPVESLSAPAGTDPVVVESIRLAFHRLAPKLRIVATLALIEGCPYAEIADAMDLPLGTVKSRVSRAVQMLRKELTRLGVQP
jgi:RNA polymerase sigma-70 factor (ECF subfamily)